MRIFLSFSQKLVSKGQLKQFLIITIYKPDRINRFSYKVLNVKVIERLINFHPKHGLYSVPLGAGPSAWQKSHDLVTNSSMAPVVHIGPLVSKQMEASLILNHCPNTEK